MGRPETKRWVSPTSALVFLGLLLMWQGHVLAATVFPLNSDSQIGSLQDSSSSWDFDDAEMDTADGEYANLFSEDNTVYSEEKDDSIIANDFIDDQDEKETKSYFDNTMKEDPYSMTVFPGETSAEPLSGARKSSNSPHNRFLPTARSSFPRIRPTYSIRNFYQNRETTSTPRKPSRFGREKMTTAQPSYPNSKTTMPSQGIHNIGDNSDDASSIQINREKARRLFSSKYVKYRNITDLKNHSNATKGSISGNTTTLLASEAAKNQSSHRSDMQESSSILQFQFPYRIPFPYVRRGSNKDEPNVKPQNTNEGVRSTDPSQKYLNDDNMRLQRRNRSKRSALQTFYEESKQATEDTETARRNDDEELEPHFEENQQHKSTERATGSVVGNSSVGGDEVAETNVRDNAPSRPPLSNHLEALERLTRLLHRMLQELSTYGQRFTLRLIRMTERTDIDQMQEIMKDFDISPGKPIFFIAGGLRLTPSPVSRVVPLTVAAEANLTGSVTVGINETESNSPDGSSTEEVIPAEVDGTTVVPILRPSGISSLPVESDMDDDNQVETTTEAVQPESEVAILGHNVRESPVLAVDSFNATTPSSSLPQVPSARRKRSIPEFDEFNFFPIPGRSARTENPYDDEDEEVYDHVYNYAQVGENVDGGWYDENPEHLTSDVSVSSGNPTVNTVSSSNIPAEIEMIDQSHSQRNDEISLNDSTAITGHASNSENSPSSLHPRTTVSSSSSSSSSLLPETGVSDPSSPLVPQDDTDGSLVPPYDSIKIKEQAAVENVEGNDQLLQGEQNIHRIQTNNAVISTVGKNNISHVDEYLLQENQLKPLAAKKNPHDETSFHSPSVSTDRISSLIPIVEDKKLISSFVDRNQKADEILNLAHEISVEEPRKEVLGGTNKLEIYDSLSSPSVPLEHASGSFELLSHTKVGNSQLVTHTPPADVLKVEERSFLSNSDGGAGKHNIAQKVPLHEIILIKEERVEPGNRQLLSSQLNTAEVDHDVRNLSLKSGVVSENERETLVPPTLLLPAGESGLVTDIASSEPTMPILTEAETVVVPVVVEREDSISIPTSTSEIKGLVVLQDRNGYGDLEAPHRVTVISKPQESNQDDPQDEIKAVSPLPQVIIPESGINIPVEVVAIKEILPTPNNAEKVSLTSVEHVAASSPLELRTISSKPTTTINNIREEETDHEPIQVFPIPTPVDSPLDSVVAPYLHTENSVSQASSTSPIANPAEVSLVGESSGNEEQTRNNQQSFPLGENQATLVVEDMKKVVAGDEKDEIEGGKVQVSPNQQNFHAPTVLEESRIMGNNNATFLSADKASSVPNVVPIHSSEHVVLREIGTVDLSDPTVVKLETTDKNDATVRNTDVVSGQDSENSDVSLTEETNGSIFVPVLSDNLEVRSPIKPLSVLATRNADVLPQEIAKENSLPALISQEPSNVGSDILSSSEKIAVPLTDSLGTTASEERLNEGSPSTESVPLTPSVSSKDVELPVENIPIKENEGVTPLKVEENPTAVNDPTKIVLDALKVESDTAPVAVANPDTPLTISADKTPAIVDDSVGSLHETVKASPVQAVAAESSEPKVVDPDETVPTDLVTKVAPIENTADSVVSVDPVAEIVTKVVPEENTADSVVKVDPVADIVKTSSPEDPIMKVAAIRPESIESSAITQPADDIPAISPDITKVLDTSVVPDATKDTPEEDTFVNILKAPIQPEEVKVDSVPTAESLSIPVDKEAQSPPSALDEPPADSSLAQTSMKKPMELLSIESSVLEPAEPAIQGVSTNPLVSSEVEKPVAELLSTPTVPDTIIPSVSTPLVDAVKPVPEVIPSGPLAAPVPVLENVHEAPKIPDMNPTALLDTVLKSVPEENGLVQPVSVPSSSSLSTAGVSPTPGDESIISSLPAADPDAAFGVKPIDTQPHFQIPGLRPTIPERPHPDYIGFVSQGVDVDSLLYSPPTSPVIITSPPVISSYTPAAIIRKQEQMMQNYFHGLLFRRSFARWIDQ